MQPIIEPIAKSLLLQELDNHRFLRVTKNADRDIYIVNGNNAPNVMQEIGRLREISFRDAGGGTGKPADVDNFDIGPLAYQQIVLWDRDDQEIVGGYRFVRCIKNRDALGNYKLSTSEIVNYTEKLKNEFFPNTIELGRSFIQPRYQATGEDRRNIYGMDNLWDGLGALTVLYPEIQFFFGKVTMYTSYDKMARDYLLAFMGQHFPDPDHLVDIPHPLEQEYDMHSFVDALSKLDYKHGYIEANRRIRARGENIPPLFNAYMKLSPSLRTLGTAVNIHFGNVEETGILINAHDLYPDRAERYTKGFTLNPDFVKQD